MAPKTPNTTSGIEAKNLRFPEPYMGFQANACRNAPCPGFGVEAMAWVKKGRPAAGKVGVRDDYRLVNRSKKKPDGLLQCQLCGATTAIKSNEGIKAELDRLSAYLILYWRPRGWN